MPESETPKPVIYATESTRDKARVVKAKRKETWDEFMQSAIEELDPDK